jgi:hypothetical protein
MDRPGAVRREERIAGVEGGIPGTARKKGAEDNARCYDYI